MPSIVLEHVILIPLLIIQISLFPFAANIMVSSWIESRRQVALQGAADQLGSRIQQLYFSLNHKKILAGTVTQVSTLQSTIESYPYMAVGSLSYPTFNSSKLTLSLTLLGPGNIAESTVTLGSIVEWSPSVFWSNSSRASINVQKLEDGVLCFSFGEVS